MTQFANSLPEWIKFVKQGSRVSGFEGSAFKRLLASDMSPGPRILWCISAHPVLVGARSGWPISLRRPSSSEGGGVQTPRSEGPRALAAGPSQWTQLETVPLLISAYDVCTHYERKTVSLIQIQPSTALSRTSWFHVGVLCALRWEPWFRNSLVSKGAL